MFYENGSQAWLLKNQLSSFHLMIDAKRVNKYETAKVNIFNTRCHLEETLVTLSLKRGQIKKVRRTY